MKKISAGVLILNEKNEILLGHATETTRWDIPKGGVEVGESYHDAALRELKEEFGLSIDQTNMEDLGKFSYTKNKDLCLFRYVCNSSDIDLSSCHCDTHFTKADGRKIPEMDAFKWVGFNELDLYCGPSLMKVLHSIVVPPKEVLGSVCIDGGRCHHECSTQCFRRKYCSPFSDYVGVWEYPKKDEKEKLSNRVRANSEAAPWVIDEIVKLEAELDELRGWNNK